MEITNPVTNPIQTCYNCHAIHQQPSKFCSQDCFDEWYTKAQTQCLNLALDMVFDSLRRSNANTRSS